MNKTLLSLAGFLFLAGTFAIAPAQSADDSASKVETMEVAAARNYVAQHSDAVIVDVRTPVEFDLSHITGALNVNVQDDDFATLVAGLDKDKTYLVHCTKNPANGRSSRALKTLQDLGFKNLYGLEGGYIAWKEAELPLTGSEETEMD